MSNDAGTYASLTRSLETISRLAASIWLDSFIEADSEASQLAADLVEKRQARLEMVTRFEPNGPLSYRLLLVPIEDEGEPVEVAVVGCQPDVPTPEGTAARRWFFGRLSHWQPKH